MSGLLTVVITFRNEREEVANTCASVRRTAGDAVDILLIDDASDPDFDYRSVARRFDAKLVRNRWNLGVAASRDWGVEIAETPFVLLLDGHMRFYQRGWHVKMLLVLFGRDRGIWCAPCRHLCRHGKDPRSKKNIGYGARVLFSGTRPLDFLQPSWLPRRGDNPYEVPCVLGGAYFFGREYYQWLRGLEGLRSYGSDEAYLSIKAWMEGAGCRLLPDVEVGHIFREQGTGPGSRPYSIHLPDVLFNKLLIIATLFPEPETWIHAMSSGRDFEAAYRELKRSGSLVRDLRSCYQSRFSSGIETFLHVNNPSVQRFDFEERDERPDKEGEEVESGLWRFTQGSSLSQGEFR